MYGTWHGCNIHMQHTVQVHCTRTPKAMNMAVQALTEDGEGEIQGGPDAVVLVVLADKDGLVIGVVGDGVGEFQSIFDRFAGNLGRLLRAISAAVYGQGDVGVLNCSILHMECTSEVELLPFAQSLVLTVCSLNGNVVQSWQKQKVAEREREKRKRERERMSMCKMSFCFHKLVQQLASRSTVVFVS